MLTFTSVAPPRALVLVLFAGGILIATGSPSHANSTPQSLPFTQSWTDTTLITPDDDWSDVPGIVGFRGDDLTPGTGTDPQTLVAENFVVDVIANQSNPNLTTGGVAEFDGIANPSIALQGSGTADAPHIVITLNTTGTNFVKVQYLLRDLDGSSDNAAMPVALQYRVGTTGNFTNVPSAFVPDATSGPSQATQLTLVDVVLPAETGNQPVVQLRVITANAVGNDEWVAIDDIAITNATTPPSGIGSADPPVVEAGSPTLLQVIVTPGTFPTSTGLAVSCDLTPIGGAIDQPLYDDGTNGDATAGDNVFSYDALVSFSTPGGPVALTTIVTDGEARSDTLQITFTVQSKVGVTVAAPVRSLTVRPPWPNPARSAARIAYELSEPSSLRIVVSDVRGRLVAVLERRDLVPAGRHEVVWTGRDANGRSVSSGVYVCSVETKHERVARTVLLIR